MIGHCLGASGGLEAIATVKAITTGWLHPSINQFVSRHSFDCIMVRGSMSHMLVPSLCMWCDLGVNLASWSLKYVCAHNLWCISFFAF